MSVTLFIESLYKRHNEWVRVAAKHGAGDEAEDVVQDSYIKLIEWHGKQNAPTLSEPLFFFIVRNTALDITRKRKHEQGDNNIERFALEDYEEIHNDGITDIIHEQLKLLHWFDAKIMDIYFNLSRKHSEAITMRQLSSETGISLNTIYTTIKKCKQIIQTEIESEYPASARSRKD